MSAPTDLAGPTEPLVVRPIGVVRSPVKTPRDMPLNGARAVLEIHPEFEAALDGLENTSHLVVMGWFHLADRSRLQSAGTKLDPNAPSRGAFATRSPARPNPISMCVVPLLARDGLRLEVDHMDLVDGTPLVDIKSYAPGWDNVFAARRRHRAAASALPDERFAECIERDLESFLGEAARRPEALRMAAATFLATRALGVDPRDPELSVEVNRDDVTGEALMALCGVARFNGRLRVVAGAEGEPLRVRFEHGGRRVELLATGVEPGQDVASWRAAFRQLP